jgi:para-aminobenzoate synthetase component I
VNENTILAPLAPWYWRQLPLAGRKGHQVFDLLFTQEPIATLLASPGEKGGNPPPAGATCTTPLARYSICAGSPRRYRDQLQLWTPNLGKILPFLNQLLNRSQTLNQTLNNGQSNGQPPDLPPDLPFTGGWLGWLGYDLAWEIERLPWRRVDTLPFPIAYWYEPERFAVLDHEHQVLWLAASQLAQLDQMQRQLEQQLTDNALLNIPTEPTGSPGSLDGLPQFLMTPAEYQTAVLKAKDYIRAGDIFQANLSLRFAAQTQANSWGLFQKLQQINPSPFASYWRTPWGAMVSCSPERLVQLQGRTAQTRPIAGTRPRGQNPEQDQVFAEELRHNCKENAEHIMLVDLERNDLGRVCDWGTVVVDELLVLEYYSHVMHLVSNVVGRLAPGQNGVDLIRALFPGGTITGCPKVRCLEIIEELEPVRRSLFYGSCGYLDQRGNLDLNILIRTLLMSPIAGAGSSCTPSASPTSLVWGQVGAGIVADSDPEREWLESLQKAKAQLMALQQVG